MKKFTLRDGLIAIIWLLPFIYLLIIYPKLPATIAVHYDVDGKPNGFGPRIDIWFIQCLISGVSGGLYLLLKFLPVIDPKRQVKYSEEIYQKIAFIVVTFISALSLVTQHAALVGGLKQKNLVFILISLLLVFMGNMMHSVKPNYFIGIRTPWTLENEDTWRATHRLASKVWVGAGLLLTVLMLFLHGRLAFIVFMVFILGMTLIPVIYSYRYFKKHTVK